MQELTKADVAARDALAKALTTWREELEDAVAEFNDTVEEAWEKVENALGDYNHTVAEVNAWVEEIATRIKAYRDTRSDKWQDSARGHAYQAWLDAYETSMREVHYDEPRRLRPGIGDDGTWLDDLPEEVDLP